jgi:4-hydroxybenzoate polyprenyltransferase
MFAISGALTSNYRLGWLKWVVILSIATCFHFFAYVTNDLIDLELDKTSALRSNDPMARGLVSTRWAIVFAVIQFPLSMFFCGVTDISLQAKVVLAGAFILILVYNFWGKRAVLPILTDIIQGLSWALVFIFGALAAGIPKMGIFITGVTFIVAFIVMINGVHGSIRDIQADSAYNVHTMVIKLGGKFIPPNSVFLPTGLKLYAAILHLILLVSPFLLAWFSRADYQPLQLYVLLSILVLFETGATWLGWKAMQKDHLVEMISPGTVHAFLILFTFVLSLFLFKINWITLCIIVFLFCAPAVAGGWLVDSITTTLKK